MVNAESCRSPCKGYAWKLLITLLSFIIVLFAINKEPVIGFVEGQSTFCESDGTVNIMVESDGVNPETVSVDYFFISGTAESM